MCSLATRAECRAYRLQFTEKPVKVNSSAPPHPKRSRATMPKGNPGTSVHQSTYTGENDSLMISYGYRNDTDNWLIGLPE